jgi:hypothetical protein
LENQETWYDCLKCQKGGIVKQFKIVVKAFEILGFHMVREREHIYYGTRKSRRQQNPSDHAAKSS